MTPECHSQKSGEANSLDELTTASTVVSHGSWGTSSRNWCETLNNYDINYLTELDNILTRKTVKYSIVGKEVGAEGNLHLYSWQ